MSATITCQKWNELFDAAPRGAAAVLVVDLTALVDNWRVLDCLSRGAETAAVVKADAYGVGAAPTALALHAAGCRSFFVAQLQEAAELRLILPKACDIAVLNGLAGARPADFVHLGVAPVLNSAAEVALWLDDGRDPAQAMLHLDTGMRRLGMGRDEFAVLLHRRPQIGALPWRAAISHLACADAPDHPMNLRQLGRFAQLLTSLTNTRFSLAASSGIFLGPGFTFDLTRPGAALYGVAPRPDRPNPMRPVAHLAARILQVREIDAGESVGYGGGHCVTRPSRIATIAVGYADGWMRASAGRGFAWIEADDAARDPYLLPILGRISMDLITLDATDAPPHVVHPGAIVHLLGARRGVDDLAADWGTIGYEVLTQLGRRHHRRWLGAATFAGECAA